MTQAQLPNHLEEIAIRDMLEGESGYAYPWAMWADVNGRLWLNGDYPFCKEADKTAQMKITRIDKSFEVDISRCKNERWALKEIPSWGAARLLVINLVQ